MGANAVQRNDAARGHEQPSDRICLQSSSSAELVPVAALQPIEPAWDKLAAHVSEPNIFYERWALQPALRAFCFDPDVRIFLFWAGVPEKSDLLGLFPLGPKKRFGRWPVRHAQNWTHHNCFLGTPLIRKGFEHQFWHALFGALDDDQWPGFLHINGLTVGGPIDDALRTVSGEHKRRCDLVYSEARALLKTDLDPESYYQSNVNGKKRKELRRQRRRLGEEGDLQFIKDDSDGRLDQWTDEFLELEQSGWKGKNRSALACAADTSAFFRETLWGAAAAGKLERRDLRLNGKPIAMLVSFISGPGGFGFKTAFNEDYARFSPGVLLQLENLEILNNPAIRWMDSCAASDHPMIDGLWSERRHIGRFSVALRGTSRRALFNGVRFGEDVMARIKRREIVDITKAAQ